MAEETAFRQGHRQRVRARFIAEGVDRWEDYRIVELLLFSAIPRRDVKDIAHRLVARFGDLDGILSASPEELCSVEGVGVGVAELLCAVYPAALAAERVSSRPRLFHVKRLSAYLTDRLERTGSYRPVLLMFNNRYELLGEKELPANSITAAGITVRCMVEELLSVGATAAVIGIPTRREVLVPSSEELAVCRELAELFELLDVSLSDCVLVRRDRSLFLSAVDERFSRLAQKKRGLEYES